MLRRRLALLVQFPNCECQGSHGRHPASQVDVTVISVALGALGAESDESLFVGGQSRSLDQINAVGNCGEDSI